MHFSRAVVTGGAGSVVRTMSPMKKSAFVHYAGRRYLPIKSCITSDCWSVLRGENYFASKSYLPAARKLLTILFYECVEDSSGLNFKQDLSMNRERLEGTLT